MSLIQIKRSDSTASPPSLANGELAWSSNGDILFIGSESTVTPIAAKRYPGVLTANTSLVANATGEIDQIKTDNLTLTDYSVISVSNTANSTQIGASAGGSNTELATTDAIKTYVDSAVSESGINDLNDVTAPSPNDDNILVYDAVAGQWENHTVSGTASEIELSKVDNNWQIGLPDSVVITTALTVATNAFKANTGINFDGANGIKTNDSQIVHDNLSGFVADEHVAHTGVTMTAGAGLTGGGDISTTRTFNVGAGNGITVNADDVAVNAGTGVVSNSTGVHIGQPVGTTDDVTFNDMTLTGNLDVNGTLTTIDTTSLAVNDSIIELARNNGADTLDSGWYSTYNDGTERYAGIVRDATDGKFRVFANNTVEPTTTVDTGGVGHTIGTMIVNIEGGTVSGLSTDIAVADGGTGHSTLTDNAVLVGDGTNPVEMVVASNTTHNMLQWNGSSVVFGALDGGSY